MLMILAGPVNGKTYTPGAGYLSECLAAKPLGEVLWREPVVVQEAGQAFHRSFLVALSACEFGLAAGLLVNNRGHERRDRFALMAVGPRE
jgi:hypothetical protein